MDSNKQLKSQRVVMKRFRLMYLVLIQ